MFDNDNRFAMIGGMVVLLGTGLLARMVLDATADPKVVASITAQWVWAGHHLAILSWVAVAIIAIVGISTPWIFMTRERFWENNPLAGLGFGVVAAGVGVMAAATISSVAFLARIGWIWGGHFFGK